MTLAELTTPFERRRIIEYGSDGNKVVRHWREMQQITDTLYKGKEETNEWNETEFDIFLCFHGVHDGTRLMKKMKHPEWYTIDKMQESAIKASYDSVEHYLSSLDELVNGGRWIDNATIDFARQFDTGRADKYAEHRAAYIKKREEAERVRIEEEEKKRIAELEEEKRRDTEERAAYFGWVDQMTPMKFGKVKSSMEKLIRIDGKVMTKRDMIITCVRDGWAPERKDNVVTYYGSKWNVKESKPKTEYKLKKDGYAYVINKTEFDFATFLYEKQ